jgi:hypothetical protein
MFSELEAPKPNGELPVNLLNYIEVLTVLFGEHAPLLVLAVFQRTKLIPFRLAVMTAVLFGSCIPIFVD